VLRWILDHIEYVSMSEKVALVDLGCGSLSSPDMHEIAVVSGFAAAYRLGAEYVDPPFHLFPSLLISRESYPFLDDEKCKRLFKLYLALSHGMRLVRENFFPFTSRCNAYRYNRDEKIERGFLDDEFKNTEFFAPLHEALGCKSIEMDY
jgi:hypothetical protein